MLEYYDVHFAAAQRVLESVSIVAPQSRSQTLLLPTIAIGIAVGGFIAVKIKKHYVSTMRFSREVRRMLPASLGIEILCVASAEVGGLLGLYYFGFNAFGITMAYVMAYALAGFTTFTSILGRGSVHMHRGDNHHVMCCGDIEHGSTTGFLSNMKQTFTDFGRGISRMKRLYRQPERWKVIKASLLILISAESGCIIAAATVDVMLYQYSTLLSIPSALLAGTFTVAFIAAYRSSKEQAMEEQKVR